MNILHKYIYLVIAAFLLLPTTCHSENNGCIQTNGRRHLVGPSPLTNELRTIAENSGVEFFANGQFKLETFKYLGTVKTSSGKKWYIVFLTTEWGGACRHTPRLLIFKADKKYLGQYSHFYPVPTKIKGDTIYFDSDPKVGNIIKFTNKGPPKTAWLDGDVLTLYKK